MRDPKYRYVLEVSAEQAYLLRDACELLARCRMGQIADACQEVLDATGQAVVPWAVAHRAEVAVKAAVGLEPNQSWGVGRHESADMAFELHRTLRHRLAWDYAQEHGLTRPDGSRNWETMAGVDYDEPIIYTTQPPAKIARQVVVGQPDEDLTA
jgi:hypothetical protein